MFSTFPVGLVYAEESRVSSMPFGNRPTLILFWYCGTSDLESMMKGQSLALVVDILTYKIILDNLWTGHFIMGLIPPLNPVILPMIPSIRGRYTHMNSLYFVYFTCFDIFR